MIENMEIMARRNIICKYIYFQIAALADLALGMQEDKLATGHEERESPAH